MAAGLQDGDATVRFEAAFAVGQLFDVAGLSTLENALAKETEPRVRLRLIEGLGKCGDSTAVDVLAGFLADEDLETARFAATALGVLANRGTDITATGNALNNAVSRNDPELTWRCLFAAYRGEVLGAGSGIRQALRQNDPQGLIFACRAAGRLGTRKLNEQVLPLLKHEDWRVRVEALKALGEAKLDFYTAQASLLLEDPNEHVRLTAIETMGQFAQRGGLGRLQGLSESDDWRIRSAVLAARARGQGDGALGELQYAIKDPNWRIRSAAATALGTMQSEQSLMLLESMVKDESPQVLTAVANSLVEMPQRHAVVLNRGLLTQDDSAVLTSAASAAGQRYDLSAVPLLVDAYDVLQSPVDTEVMTAILQALGEILSADASVDRMGELSDGDRARAEALLDSARHDPDITVATTAADALSTIRQELVNPASEATPRIPTHLDLDLAVALEAGKVNPIVRLVTNRGVITLRLFGAEAPGTVANFVTLARSGYYNGLTFHRVVSDFVIQGGDPRGDGWGGPGYAIRCEYNPLHYETGRLGMALAGKDTGGSQFFITHSAQPHLDGRYTIFGEVIDGADVVDQVLVGDRVDEVQLEGI
jgi:peptidylprolyl isomerase